LWNHDRLMLVVQVLLGDLVVTIVTPGNGECDDRSLRVLASLGVVTSGALIRDDVEPIGLHGEVERLVDRRDILIVEEVLLVITSVDNIVPGVRVALFGSVVTDLNVDEAVADAGVLTEGIKWHNEETGLIAVSLKRIETVRDLSG